MQVVDDNDDDVEAVEYVGADDVVELRPGPNADASAEIDLHISAELHALYDVYSYRHAAAIIASSYPTEFADDGASRMASSDAAAGRRRAARTRSLVQEARSGS